MPSLLVPNQMPFVFIWIASAQPSPAKPKTPLDWFRPALPVARAQVLPKEIAVGVIVERAVPCGERRAGLVVAAIEAFNAVGGRIAGADQMLRRHGKRLVQEGIHIIQIVRLALLAVMQR